MTSIYTWYSVHLDYIQIKFNFTASTETLIKENFSLSDLTGATPFVLSGFKEINIQRDYDSVSRTLNLWFDFELEEYKTYQLDISGLKNIIGQLVGDDIITFETAGLIGLSSAVIPTREILSTDVEDYSIKDTNSFLSLIPDNDVSFLQVENVSPESDIAFYLAPEAKEGRIDIKFNQSPAANFISSDYFKVQRKLVTKSLVRWTDVDALITADTENGYVFIYLPSIEDTPVYGEPNKIYWETGYKYRVRILAGIGI
jgi:hypothetical protein